MKKVIYVILFTILVIGAVDVFEESGRSRNKSEAMKKADKDARKRCPSGASKVSQHSCEWTDLVFVKGYWVCTAKYSCY